jgi:hypothetical protein
VKRARCAAVALAAAAVIAAASPPAAAQADPPAHRPMEEAAAEHMQRGLAAYQERSYDRAAAEFRAGYAIDPHPDFLFPWAQAERLAGRCGEAVRLYRQVLATGLAPEEARTTRQLMEQCQAQIVRAGPPPAPSGPRPGQPALAPPPAGVLHAAPPPARPWYRDVWGGALLGSGALVAGVGAGFLASAAAADRAARSADGESLDEFASQTDRARSRRRVGVIALGAGGGLIAAAIVRYVLRARDPAGDEPRALLLVAPGDDSIAVTAGVSGRF